MSGACVGYDYCSFMLQLKKVIARLSALKVLMMKYIDFLCRYTWAFDKVQWAFHPSAHAGESPE